MEERCMGQLRAIKKNQRYNVAEMETLVKQAYLKGKEEGRLEGYYKGAETTVHIFFDALETLQTIKDIGPKRYQSILRHFNHLKELTGGK
jgi:hypothetical protein